MRPKHIAPADFGTYEIYNDPMPLISMLARALAIELDYHYEDDAAPVISGEISLLTYAAGVLTAYEHPVPKVTKHTIRRFKATKK